MPKVIKDIKEKILSAALTLFDSIGYQNVNMRKIAKEADIAVGTLYNHYPNKETLFLNALESSWKGTIDKLNSNMLLEKSSYEHIELFITTLYDSIVDRKGLGKELLIEGIKQRNEDETFDTMSTIFGEVKKLLETLVTKYYEEENEDTSLISRKIDTAIAVVGQLTSKYPTEREININYLTDLLVWRT